MFLVAALILGASPKAPLYPLLAKRMEDSLLDSKDQENLKKEQEQLEINVRLKLKETVASNRQNRPGNRMLAH